MCWPKFMLSVMVFQGLLTEYLPRFGCAGNRPSQNKCVCGADGESISARLNYICQRRRVSSSGRIKQFWSEYILYRIQWSANRRTEDHLPGRTVQSVTCLTADTYLTACSILARSHTFVQIDHEIISTTILLPSANVRRVAVRYTRKYVHEVLVNSLVKLAQERVWLGELTVLTWP